MEKRHIKPSVLGVGEGWVRARAGFCRRVRVVGAGTSVVEGGRGSPTLNSTLNPRVEDKYRRASPTQGPPIFFSPRQVRVRGKVRGQVRGKVRGRFRVREPVDIPHGSAVGGEGWWI